MGRTEAALHLQTLAGLGWQPRFALLLCATADSRSAHPSRLTLESLSNRVHGNSRLYISADKPAAAASCRRLIKECPGPAYGKILTANAAGCIVGETLLIL
jgi:hypothetical protein